MKTIGLISIVVLTLGACSGPPASSNLGTAEHTVVIEGIEIKTECSPVPDGVTAGQGFTIQMVIQNGERLIPPADPDFPAGYCPADARIFNTSVAEGEGSIGRFNFFSRWCGLPEGDGVVWAAGDVFHTEQGDLVADERFTSSLLPDGNRRFSGAFTVVGGTGRYQGVRGHALGAAQQIAANNGTGRTAVAACGWIEERE